MDTSDIKELIDILSDSNVSDLEIESEGFKLKLAKTTATVATPAQVVTQMAAAVPAPAVETPGAAAPEQPEAEEDEAGLVDITTPFVGTFYRAPSPDADPFVDIGSRIKKGQTLCIVEAMKLMNEIEAEINGIIKQILVENGEPVEYGQVLFYLEPN